MEKKEIKGGVFSECLLMNIFPAGCPHGQGGEGGQPNADSCRQGEEGEGSKITKNVRTSFMDGPLCYLHIFCH